MKKILIILSLLVLLGVLFSACDKTPVGPQTQGQYEELVTANNDFAFKLFAKLHEETPDENIFISPTSIAAALAMTYNGADGDTKDGMAQTLEVNDLSIEELNKAWKSMQYDLQELDPKVRLDLAQAIFIKEGFPVKQDFVQTNQEYYEAEVSERDFGDPATLKAINNWAKNNTNGKIPKVLDKIDASAVMFLLNAIYFKGDWTYSFDNKLTTAANFQKDANTTLTVDMMQLKRKFDYYQKDGLQMIDLPYGKEVFSMTLILPPSSQSMDDFIHNMDLESWKSWTSQLSESELELRMPKYEIRYEYYLNDALKALGMENAFSPGADFGKMTDADVYIDFVKHDSYIKVDEKGTEAAAVTTVGIVETSLPPGMTINQPFILAIRERSTNNLLFLGKIMDPS